MSDAAPTTSKSPLSEANPESLQELFDRDPLELSKQDITRIVTELRANRHHFVKEETRARKAGKKNPGGAAAKATAKRMTLDDLDLKL